MTYSMMPDGHAVRRDADSVTFTPDPSSDLPAQRDYQAWIVAGNVPTPAVVLGPPKRQVTGTQFMAALVDLGLKAFFDQAASQTTKPLDAWYYRALTPNDFYLEDNAKLGRLCTKAIALGAAAVPPVVFTMASIINKALTE